MSNTVLYAWGLFQPAYTCGITNQEQVLLVGPSGFSTVILWTLHVDPQGNLTYNDPPPIVTEGQFSSQYEYLAGLIRELKLAGVQKALFGIGSGGGPQDFTNILNLLQTPEGTATLKANFGALASALPIDGFDLDIEDLSYEQSQVQPVADFTLLLHNLNAGSYLVTYCPYMDDSWWFDCLRAVYQTNGGQQVVSWFNLQCYAGGSFNQPATWVKNLASYQGTQPVGVANPAAFIVPGYWCRNGTRCDQGDCPSDIRGIFSGLVTSDPGITGGFIWNSRDIFCCMGKTNCSSHTLPFDYAHAILNGLGADLPDRASAVEGAPSSN